MIDERPVPDPGSITVAEPDASGRVHRLRRVTDRIGWGVGDQALSSLTNFTLGIIVAREVTAAEFGAFTVAFATFLVAMNVTRHLAAQPLAIRYATVDLPTWRRASGSATGLILVLSVAMGIISIGIAVVTGGPLAEAYLAMGLTLPGLLIQDGWRFAFFAHRRGRSAFLNDLLWAVIMFPALIIVAALGLQSLFTVVMCWGVAACVAALVGIVQVGARPAPGRARAWWREHRDIGPRYLASELAFMGATQFVFVVVGAIAGLAAAGGLRAAQLLLGPVNILSMGLYMVAVPEGARLVRTSVPRFRTASLAIGTGLLLATLAWSGLILLIPPSVGVQLLGASWPLASLVMLPVALGLATRVFSYGFRIGLASMAQADRTLRVSLIDAAASIAMGIVGTVLGGALGAAWLLAAVSLAMIPIWWHQFDAGIRSYVSGSMVGSSSAPATSTVRAASVAGPPER